MNDLISRQAAIDALGERPEVWIDDDEYSLGQRNQYDIDRLAIETVPSAQPEKAQLSGEDTTSDCITRKAAIDAIVNRTVTVDTDLRNIAYQLSRIADALNRREGDE